MSGDRYTITDQNACYFLTFTIVDWVDVFIRPGYKQIVTDSLNFCIEKIGLIIYGLCLMTNHIHLIAEAKEGYKLTYIIRDLKKFTAYSILKAIDAEPESRKDWMLYRFRFAGKCMNGIEEYHFWKSGIMLFSLILFKPQMTLQKLNYIHENPVRAHIVENAEDYLYSSAKDYCGKKGLVKIEFI